MEKNKTYSLFTEQFCNTICKLTQNKIYSNIIFLCIGTDRVTGDTFGPLIGYKLKNALKYNKNIEILGDLNKTVSNENILDIIEYIKNNYKNPFIVSIDSALSLSRNIGDIVVQDKGIYLGSCIRNNKVYIGDMNIQGVVGKNTCVANKNFIQLQNTNLGMVMNMADIVTKGILSTMQFEY